MTYPQGPQDPRQWQTQPGYGPHGQAYPPPRPPKRSSNTALILVVIGAVLLVAFGGCAILVSVIGSTPTSSTSEPGAGLGRVAKAGTPVRDGDFEFAVTSVETATHLGGQILGVEAKGVFMIVRLRATNIGRDAQYISDSNQKLIDEQGREYAPSSSAAAYVVNAGSLFERLNPGLAAEGVVVFDVPRGVRVAAIEVHDSVFSRGARVALT
jgi:hypothetical protein